jgi:hypothetical protein
MKVRIEWHNSGGVLESREVILSDTLAENRQGQTIAASLISLIGDTPVYPGDSFQIVEVS